MVRSLWVGLIGSGVDGVMHGDLVIDWGLVDHGGYITGNLWCVDWGGVVHRLHWTVGRGGGAVAVHSGVVDTVVDSMDWTCSISISLSVDCRSRNCQDLEESHMSLPYKHSRHTIC